MDISSSMLCYSQKKKPTNSPLCLFNARQTTPKVPSPTSFIIVYLNQNRKKKLIQLWFHIDNPKAQMKISSLIHFRVHSCAWNFIYQEGTNIEEITRFFQRTTEETIECKPPDWLL
ncbi:hypothetical protein Hanom_Chr13g01206841 [Helianthus anomalus]